MSCAHVAVSNCSLCKILDLKNKLIQNYQKRWTKSAPTMLLILRSNRHICFYKSSINTRCFSVNTEPPKFQQEDDFRVLELVPKSDRQQFVKRPLPHFRQNIP